MSGPDITRNFRVEEIGTATVLHFSGRTFMAAQVEELLTMMTKVGNVASNATIYGDYQVLVQATNIVNHGALKVSEFGLVSLAGKTVDTSRGWSV